MMSSEGVRTVESECESSCELREVRGGAVSVVSVRDKHEGESSS